MNEIVRSYVKPYFCISINYKYDVEKTFAENAVQVHKRITRKLKRYKVFVLQFLARLPMTLIDAVLLNTYNSCCEHLAEKTAKVLGYFGKYKKDLGISNLTVIDIPTSYGNYKITNIDYIEAPCTFP